MQYNVHSSHSKDIDIKLISNGFVITYRVNTRNVETYCHDLEEVQKFLENHYRKEI
jgi:hypothetical protein